MIQLMLARALETALFFSRKGGNKNQVRESASAITVPQKG